MNRTRSALITSLLSFILCCVMLLLTSYAWFTDSTTSTGNRIVSGSLNIDLMKRRDSGNYTSIVGEANTVFVYSDGNNHTWEPGDTYISYLAVQNNGDIDAVYSVAMNITGNVLGRALEYAFIPMSADVENTCTATIDASEWSTFAGIYQTATLGGEGTRILTKTVAPATDGRIGLAAGCVDYYALVVHMSDAAIADTSYANKKIEFNLEVVATQPGGGTESFPTEHEADAPDMVEESATVIEATSKSGITKLISDAFGSNSGKAVKVVLTEDYGKKIIVGDESGSASDPQRILYIDLNGHNIDVGSNSTAIYVGYNCKLIVNNSANTAGVISSQNDTIQVFPGASFENRNTTYVSIVAKAAQDNTPVKYVAIQ